jgi:hypothetical protein
LAAGRTEEAQAIRTCVGTRSPLWGPLLRMLDKKCEKRYETDGHPTGLLLFYERESPFQPFEELFDIHDALHHMMSRSQFSDVWFYHHAMSYGMKFPEITASEGLVFRAPLSSLVAPEDQRHVIGRMWVREGKFAMAFDASFDEGFGKGIRFEGLGGFER